jgi:hypothetical protein
MTPLTRTLLRWLPVGIGLAALLAFVGWRLYQRTMDRTTGVTRGTPISAPALEGKSADDLLNKLGVAMSLRDAQRSEQLAEQLSRGGDDVLPGLVRLLLWLDPVPPEPIFNGVMKYFRPRSMAMAVILEVSRTPWIGIGPAPRKLRILIARGILLHSKDLEPAIDLNGLFGPRFDQTSRPDGKLGLALVAAHLKLEGWERLARGALAQVQDLESRDELIQAVADAFGKEKAAGLK